MTARKRFKRNLPLLESLPNEMFIEIFYYLLDVDIVYAFSKLNKRFQNLITNYCSAFDFKSVNKAKFDYIIRQHDVHRWRSLRLSDDDITPGQVAHFCQLCSFPENVSQLKALSVVNIKLNSASLLTPHLTSFNQLVSLSIGHVCGKNIPLVELPALKYVVVNSCMHSNWMKMLQLKSLQHTIEHDCSHENSLTWPTTLKKLKVYFRRTGDDEIIRASLKHLSQLTSLSIYGTAWESPAPDGQIWENLITSAMPLLENFQFCFKFWRDFNVTSDIKQIVSTFSTSFYLKERSWFIQCDAHRQQFSIAILYSLPFEFEHFEIVTKSFDESVSTWNNCSNNDFRKDLYKNVSKLTVNVPCDKMNQTLILVNVTDLTLKFSIGSIDWILSMRKLYKLSLGYQFNMSSNNFMQLLKHTPCLCSLAVSCHTLKLLTDQWKHKAICDLLSHKIRSLEISSNSCFPMNSSDYVEVNDLLPIVRIFNERCRYLNIIVYSRNLVSGLILRIMRHLRSLKVRLEEHNDDRKITKEWLAQQDITFKNLDCSIVQNGNEYSFWFGRRK
ncbi:unnamed protein product [Rotaria magnacalcarata]|uniref:F-box domain-containing protein n=1 Tax=Rotaria magnacalcarata TaxID=392030 RepID=A0A819Q9K6_9BILA|nr:unnamed protein product [Rotaria magnacalcarata]CAF2139997.1 unnamed protein product [Rotaria magnacalcarata]CAF3877363.1 unnamed protein product [Rotaria magnacalcarata]CAF4024920.1 unnamed protein product [Rotaria magnacalcarata]